MEKINSKKALNIVSICIVLIVPFLKFFSMNLEMFGLINNYDFINPALILYISIPFLLIIYILNLTKRKLDIYDYIFYLLIISLIVSTVFSIDKSLAILGGSYRHEGLFTICSYYLLFINYKTIGDTNDIKKILKVIIILGVLNSIYALIQIYTNYNFILRYYNDTNMASGMCGNPNFFGTLITTLLGIVLCKTLINKKTSDKYLLLLVLFFISLINSQSTGPFLAFILTFIFLIIFLSHKNMLNLRKLLVVVLALLCTYLSVYLVNKYKYIFIQNNQAKEGYRCETCLKAIKETVDSGGSGRVEIWKNSIDIVKDNFWVGVGYDNFYLAYPNPKIESGITISTNADVKKLPSAYYIIDNAHNVYLHILVSNGIIGLIPYLILCLLTFIKGLKSKNLITFVLLGGFVAYSIQAFVNINVVQVTPIYYILIGLILSEQKKSSYIK